MYFTLINKKQVLRKHRQCVLQYIMSWAGYHLLKFVLLPQKDCLGIVKISWKRLLLSRQCSRSSRFLSISPPSMEFWSLSPALSNVRGTWIFHVRSTTVPLPLCDRAELFEPCQAICILLTHFAFYWILKANTPSTLMNLSWSLHCNVWAFSYVSNKLCELYNSSQYSNSFHISYLFCTWNLPQVFSDTLWIVIKFVWTQEQQALYISIMNFKSWEG